MKGFIYRLILLMFMIAPCLHAEELRVSPASNQTTNAAPLPPLELRQTYSDKPTLNPDLFSGPYKKRLDVLPNGAVQYRGLAAQLVRTPKNFKLFHLLNPFAPAEYGVPEWTGFAASRPLPRAFLDPLTHEPQGILISIGR